MSLPGTGSGDDFGSLRAGTVFVHRSASVIKGVRVEGEPKTRAGRRTVFLNRALGERLNAQ